jgi:hypothetical protein
MTYGLAPAYANQLLDTLGGTSFTPPAAIWAELHIDDPGVAGTSNPSSVTTRQQVTWSAAANGTKAIANLPSWGTWAGTSPETIRGLAFWDASTGGAFKFSAQLTAPVTVQTGDPLTLPALTVNFAPVAA